MQLSAIFILGICLQAAASGRAQTVTFSGENVPLQKIFAAIEEQTGFVVAYSENKLANALPVTLRDTKLPLTDFLDLVLRNQPFGYSIESSTIFIRINPAANLSPRLEVSAPTIRGRVLDDDGQPLAGASVAVKKSKSAEVTDAEGVFNIYANEGDIIVVSFVGYQSREFRVSTSMFNGETLTLTLSKVSIELNEVVINKGYYTEKRSLSVSTVSKITAKEISKQPVSNPLAALQGRAAGLLITQRNGLPGSTFNILIRGRNSIQQGTDPLVLIDGVPFPINQLNQRNFINANHPLNTLNPLDIESVEILKDADATAIYGSRGANGVILITTKKGKGGATRIDLQVNRNWAQVTRVPEYLATAPYLAMRREAFENDGVLPTAANAPDLLLWDSTAYTDWTKELIGGTATTWQGQLGLSGGTELTRFSFTGNYYKETTVYPTDLGTKRLSGRFQLDHKSRDQRFQFSLNSSYGADHSRLVTTDLTNSISLPPNMPDMFDENGNLTWQVGGITYPNPYRHLKEKYSGKMDRFTTNATVSYRLLKGLELKVSAGYNTLQLEELNSYPKAAQNPQFAFARSNFANNRTQSWIAEPQIGYSTQWNDHNFSFLVGGSYQHSRNQTQVTDASGYPNDNVLEGTAGATTVLTTIGGSTYRYGGHFARINYDFRKVILLSLSGRRDGSSRFGPGNRLANFGAIGAGWIFHKSSVLKGLSPVLSFGKLRGSIGTTGNDQIGDYQYIDSWVPTSTTPYAGIPGFRPSRLFNPTYRWEQLRKIDVGLELGFWQDRLQLNTTWFNSRSTNQILYYNLPSQTGFTNVLMNFPGVVANRGWEWELNYHNASSRKWNWTTQFNLTLPKNELLAFPGLAESSYAQTYQIGQPLNLFWGYPFRGVDPATGLYTFLNSTGELTSAPNRLRDFKVLGTLNPSFYGGWSNTLRYKSWQLNIFFQFVRQQGRDLYYSAGSSGGGRSNIPVAMLNRWQKPGDEALFQPFSQVYFGAGYSAAFAASTSTASLVDASFIRLKNMEVSYQLPLSITRIVKMNSFRIFLQGQNLLTLTRYKGGDPETQSRMALPPLRVISIGIHSSF